jgi:hypothetical protein
MRNYQGLIFSIKDIGCFEMNDSKIEEKCLKRIWSTRQGDWS